MAQIENWSLLDYNPKSTDGIALVPDMILNSAIENKLEDRLTQLEQQINKRNKIKIKIKGCARNHIKILKVRPKES